MRFFRGEFAKKSSYMMQVSFAGFKVLSLILCLHTLLNLLSPFQGKTHVAKNTSTPEWNEEINFAWVFPSVAQDFLILIFLYENLQWKCISEYEIAMEEIAFKGGLLLTLPITTNSLSLSLYRPTGCGSHLSVLLRSIESVELYRTRTDGNKLRGAGEQRVFESDG